MDQTRLVCVCVYFMCVCIEVRIYWIDSELVSIFIFIFQKYNWKGQGLKVLKGTDQGRHTTIHNLAFLA